MSPTELVRTRTISPLAKVCMGELGCKRPVRPSMGLCRLHQARKARLGTTTSRHTLRRRQRLPFVQAAFSWFKERIKERDTGVLQTLTEFDSYLRLRCEHIYASDLGRRRINSHRKMQGILANILKRWPDGHQAAVAVLSVILGTRLACAHEPGVTRHPAFLRAMQVHAVYSLVRRKNIKGPLTMPRPQLAGRWLAKRLDDAVSPFLRFMCASTKDRDNAILAKVATRQYIKIRWESLSSKYLIPNHKRTRRGHPCPWKGSTSPKKGDKYNVSI